MEHKVEDVLQYMQEWGYFRKKVVKKRIVDGEIVELTAEEAEKILYQRTERWAKKNIMPDWLARDYRRFADALCDGVPVPKVTIV